MFKKFALASTLILAMAFLCTLDAPAIKSIKPPKAAAPKKEAPAKKPNTTKTPKTTNSTPSTPKDELEYNKIIDSWNLDSYQSFLNMYPNSDYAKAIKERIAEIELWNKAKREGTEEAFQEYLSNPSYHHFTSEAEEALEEARNKEISDSWRAAYAANTIPAYEQFIAKYPTSIQATQARINIDNIRANEEWDMVKNSLDTNVLANFISKYPNYPEIAHVKSRLHAIKGKESYERGNLNNASYEFSLVTDEVSIPSDAMEAFEAVEEYKIYTSLSEDSSRGSLNDFLKKFPNSKYKDDVRNYIALSLSDEFNENSKQEDYDHALSFATGKTQEVVKNRIKANKNEISAHKSFIRRLERYENGGWGGLEFEYADVATNFKGKEDRFVSYNFGVKFRMGNYKDRVVGTVGIKPGIGVWDFDRQFDPDTWMKHDWHNSRFFYMPVEAELRVTLVNAGWLYLDGRFDYNVVRNKKIQRPMAWRAGIGFSGALGDLTLYYGQEIGDIDSEYQYLNRRPNPFYDKKNSGVFGISLGFYVPLF